MKITKILLPICLLFFTSQTLFSQSFQASKNIEILKQNEWKKDISTYSDHADFFKNEYQNLGLAKVKSVKLMKIVETKGDWKHFRYQQYFEGIPVLNGVYILHEHADVLQKANGNILPNIDVKTTPSISNENAILVAKNEAIRTEIADNHGTLPSGLTIDGIENSAPKLVIVDKYYPENSGKYTLAFQFELEFNSFPPKHDEYLVDAHSGEVISMISQVCHVNVPGTVKTKHYGDRMVMIDSISSTEYLLSDTTRGDGIITTSDISDEVFMEADKYFDTYNSDSDDAAAGDAHWGATEYYDWLLGTFSWDGLDNEGHELRSVIHTGNGRSYVNAFWNGRYASFGDGNCVEYGPLTTLDVVSHEFTHGLTEFTSGLVYRNESGALNESMSDMFGKALEWYEDRDNFTWEIGRAFIKSADATPFRNMADPYERNHPKLYKGDNWSGFGAVHTNSNVMNHWFYLLVEGGRDTNEIDIAYDVQAIGMDKAMDVVFATNTGYLVPNSDYLHAYHSTVEVTTDLWGVGSAELASVKEAWKAVGIVVPDAYTLAKDLTIRLLNQDSLICGSDGELEIMVEIENLSIGDFAAGTEIPVSFQLNSSGGSRISSEVMEVITLTDNFASGDTIRYTFVEKMKFDESTGFRDKLEVLIGEDFEDENKLNDNDLREVVVTETAGTDLSLRASRLSTTECEPDRLRFSFYVRNEGCNPIKAETEVTVELSFMGEMTPFTYMIPNELLPDDGYSEVVTLDLPTIPAGELPYAGLLKFDADENADNDDSDNDTRIYQQTGSDYFEDFTDFEIDTDPYLFLDPGYRHVIELTQYQGEQWLGFTGEDEDPSNIDPGCDDLRKILEENYGFEGRAEFCIDVEGFDTPTLSFDMVQFRKANSFSFPEEFTSVLRIDASGNSFEEVQIYGQPQGEIVSHNIPLPPNFDGRIGMEAFTMLGNETLLSTGSFGEGNVILLDNIRISNGPVSTSQIADSQSVSVFPNPATNVVWFENKSADISSFNVEIFNTLGAKIYQINDVVGKAEWKADNRPAGVYFYKIMNDGEQVDAGKLVLEK